MLAAIYCLVSEVFKPQNDYERLVLTCVENLHIFYQEISQNVWGPISSPQWVSRLGRQHIILYAELTNLSLRSGEYHRLGWHWFKFYPKHHLFIRLNDEACSG